MRGFGFWIFGFLFLSAFSFVFEDGVMEKDVPVDGTLQKGNTATYILTDVENWRLVTMAFKASTSKPDYSTVVATVTAKCDDNTMEMKLINGLSAGRYSLGERCDNGNSTITIVNNVEEDITYWGIAADQDRYMYPIQDNTPYYGYLPGSSNQEFVSYRAYIGKSSSGSGAVDFVNVTVNYDMFAGGSMQGFVAAENPRPTSRLGVALNPVSTGLFLAIDRNSKVFCEDCYLYIVLVSNTTLQSPLFYNVRWAVDRGIVHLVENEEYSGTVVPDNHGQHFIVDLRKDVYDTDIYLGFQKSNCYDVTLTVDVALTSFDDGSWDTCKSTTLEGTGLREWGISQRDACHTVGGVYYIRVWDAAQVSESCDFSIVYRITRSPATQLYKGKQVGFTSKQSKLGITYYRVNIPAEEFVDFTSVTFHMKEIDYTKTGSFWYGFDVFYGPQTSSVHVNNPADPSTYVYTTSIDYRKEISLTVTEKQEGWCVDCVYAFSVRTTNETSWIISAELGFIPFILTPNKPKSGTLKNFTGYVESSIYLAQKEYRPIEIACKKSVATEPEVVLYVSTTPNPSATNHLWKDTTAADGRAEIEIRNDHPNFCQDCYYYIAIYYMDDTQIDEDVHIDLEFNCPDGVCLYCDNGFDPSTSCTDCLPGYYGENCQKCDSCNHGTCDSGRTGTGKCICDMGWGPDGQCSECLEGFWGVECQQCPDCHNHGKCSDGLHGTGVCKCDTNFDDRVNCEDCKPGYFGVTCEGACPATSKGVCDSKGKCADKMAGNGRCTCNDGYVGIKCDTKYEDDKCSPHCITNRGSCDEEKGVCVCYEDYTGDDCGKEEVNIWIYVSLGLMSAIFLVVILVAAKKMHCTEITRKEKGKKKPKNEEKSGLLSGKV